MFSDVFQFTGESVCVYSSQFKRERTSLYPEIETNQFLVVQFHGINFVPPIITESRSPSRALDRVKLFNKRAFWTRDTRYMAKSREKKTSPGEIGIRHWSLDLTNEKVFWSLRYICSLLKSSLSFRLFYLPRDDKQWAIWMSTATNDICISFKAEFPLYGGFRMSSRQLHLLSFYLSFALTPHPALLSW